MPRITELTKAGALAVAYCFVETNQEEIWSIVKRYFTLQWNGKVEDDDMLIRRRRTAIPETELRQTITPEELAKVRHFAKHMSHLHTDTLFKKWFSPAKEEIKAYLTQQITEHATDPLSHPYRNAQVLYRYLFAGAREITAILRRDQSAPHQYALFFAYNDDYENMRALGNQGVLPALYQYKKIRKQDPIADLIWFGFDCAISIFLDKFKEDLKCTEQDLKLCHYVLKTTHNLRVVEQVEKFFEKENARLHLIIIQFFGHQCEKNIKKAHQLFNQDWVIVEHLQTVDDLLGLLADDLRSEFPLIDDPLEFFKFILKNSSSDLSVAARIEYILSRINMVNFVTQFPLCLLSAKWFEIMFSALRDKSRRMNEMLESGVDINATELITITRAIGALQEYENQTSEFYKRRISILHGRIQMLLHAFPNEHPIEQEQLAMLSRCFLTNNFKDYWKADDSEALRTLKEQCLDLHTLYPERVALPALSHPPSLGPAPVAYAPSFGACLTDPIDWANFILNYNHEEMHHLSMQLGTIIVGRHLSNEEKECAKIFNCCLGLLLSEIKENTLTVKEKDEIRKQIDQYKVLPEPFCKNAEFLEIAFAYLPHSIDEGAMSTLLVGHPYRETLILAAHIDHPKACSTHTADQHLKRALLWVDPIAFAAFIALGFDVEKFYKVRLGATGLPHGLFSSSSVRLLPPTSLLHGDGLFIKISYCWRLAEKGFKPAIEALQYSARNDAESMILNYFLPAKDRRSVLLNATEYDRLVTLILLNLTSGSNALNCKITNWEGKEALIEQCVRDAKAPIDASLIQGYFALALHNPAKIIEAVTHLSKVPLVHFTPQKAYVIALQIKQTYFDGFTDSIPATDAHHYSMILEWTLSLLSIIWFPRIFSQKNTAFNLEAAEELYTQLENLNKSAIRDESIAKRVRHRHAEINYMISGAQLTMIDLMPVDSLERSERSQLLVMRDEAERGHLFLEDTVYSFQSSDAKALLNNLLLLSGEKKSVSREPTVDHFIVPETVATRDSGIVNNDSEIVATFGGGGGGEARAEVEVGRSENVSSSKWSVLGLGGFFGGEETPKEKALREAEKAAEKRTSEAAARIAAKARKEKREQGINSEGTKIQVAAGEDAADEFFAKLHTKK